MFVTKYLQLSFWVVIPNLFLRQADIEAFEDNPEEYIRQDMERSDADTRRRAASDLVQALSAQFEPQVVAIFSAYVSALLQEAATEPRKNWRQKDVALFLVTTLASKGNLQFSPAQITHKRANINACINQRNS